MNNLKVNIVESLKYVFIAFILWLAQPVIAIDTIDVSLEKGQLLLTPRHGGDGSAWGKEQCAACHFSSKIHRDAPHIKDIVKEVGFSSCTGCHGQNGTQEPRLCTVCHNPQRLPTSPLLDGLETHDFSVNEQRQLGDKDCLTCHFSADMDGQFEPDIDLSKFPESNSTGVAFCLSCHNQTHQQPGFEMQARHELDPLVKIEADYQQVDKHGFLNGTAQGIYSGLRQGGNYQYGQVVECTDCHAMHGTHNPKLIIDRTDKGTTQLEPNLRNLPVLIDVSEGDYSQLCVTCHAMNQPVDEAHKDAGNGLSGIHLVGTHCTQCHTHSITPQQGIVVTKTDVSLAKGQLLLTPNHGWDGTAWGKEQCSACHLMNTLHNEAPRIREIVKQVGFNSCMGCHGQNGTQAPRPCTICHNQQRLPQSPIQQGVNNHNFDVNLFHPLNDDNCLICHDRSDMDGQFEFETDLTHYPSNSFFSLNIPYKNGVEFCLRCHNKDHQQSGFEMQPRFLRDPLVNMETNYRFIDKHGYPKGSGQRTYTGLSDGDYRYGALVECTDCHAMHGTHNTQLIVDRTDAGMSLLSDSIRELPVLIDVNNGDYSQLCVTCHSMDQLVEQGNEDTGNGLAGVHQIGSDCRQCHVHGLAAQTGL